MIYFTASINWWIPHELKLRLVGCYSFSLSIASHQYVWVSVSSDRSKPISDETVLALKNSSIWNCIAVSFACVNLKFPEKITRLSYSIRWLFLQRSGIQSLHLNSTISHPVGGIKVVWIMKSSFFFLTQIQQHLPN